MPRINKGLRSLCAFTVLASLFFVTNNGWSQQNILTPLEEKTLQSLAKVNDSPFYTMTYYGAYPSRSAKAPNTNPGSEAGEKWACSLFAALGDPASRVYGRNFDWAHSPALLLFCNPPDGYASATMVDLVYVGFALDELKKLDQLPLDKRLPLMKTVYQPFDGMNEYGLTIGMAAIPNVELPLVAGKKTISSLEIMREMLDHCRTVNEAVAVMEKYHVVMGNGGPMLHYLMADATGKAVLVEYNQGRMHVIPNERPWHLATNFLLTAVKSPQGQCLRFDKISECFVKTQGRLSGREAMKLLEEVSLQAPQSTQWSVVYDMSNGQIRIAFGRRYEHISSFKLKMTGP